MGVSFDRDLRIAGYRPSVFKNALAGFMRTNDPAAMVDFRTVFPNRRDGAIVFEECLDRGLITHDEEERWEVTEAGKAIVSGKARARSSYADAKVVLDELLARAHAMNGSPSAVGQVDQVWVFGSFMRGEETVGDIDLAISLSPASQFGSSEAGRRRSMTHARTLLRAQGISLSGFMHYRAEERLTEVLLFGKKRHPLLAGAHLTLDDLKSLGVPCQLIYDRHRGGRVDDPVVPRHPQSPGRSNTVGEPLRLPSLAPQREVRPMDARWLTEYDDGGDVSPYDIFRGWTKEADELFPAYPAGLTVLAKSPSRAIVDWEPSLVKHADPEGRTSVVLMHHPSELDIKGTGVKRRGLATLLERAIEDDGSVVTVRACFSALEAWRGHKRVEFDSAAWLAREAALILAVDCERAMRRAMEDGQERRFRFAIRDDSRSILGAMVRHSLNRVRTAPVGWTGPAPVSRVRASAIA